MNEKYSEVSRTLQRLIKEAEEDVKKCTYPEERWRFYAAKLEIYKDVLEDLGTDSNFMFLKLREDRAISKSMTSYYGKKWLEYTYESDGTLYAIKIVRRLLKGLVDIP